MKNLFKNILWNHFMAKIIIGPNVCDQSRDSLICQKSHYLTIRKDIDKIYDLYYLKNGCVCSVVDFFCCKGIPCYKYFVKDTLIPKAYFDIAEQLHLKVDRDTYIRILLIWMKRAHIHFHRNILSSHLPTSVPLDWKVEEELTRYYLITCDDSKKHTHSGSYADLFRICNFGCLITGNGKSDVCRLIKDDELVLDDVFLIKDHHSVYASAGLHGGSSSFIEVSYCIHMLSKDMTAFYNNIAEINLVEYLSYAECFIKHTASVESFYNIFKSANTRYILVPWCESLEAKAKLIKKFLSEQDSIR